MKKHLSLTSRLKNNLLLSQTKQRGRKVLAMFALALMSAAPAFAQFTAFTQVPPPSATFDGTSNNYRAPGTNTDYQRTATIYLGTEVVGVPTNTPITRLGFSIATPAATAASGTIKIYMGNTTDATYQRGQTWTDIIATPTPLTLVYDGPLTIPATAGTFTIPLTTPYTYTGSNFYFAYEWNATTKAATGAIYNANTALGAGSLVTAISATAQPATLPNLSAFRPVLIFGYTPPANDFAVQEIFAQGKLALSSGKPHVVRALIKNTGSTTETKNVTLAISGANTFTATYNNLTLPAGADSIISFAPFTPTAPGNNSALVSVPTGDAVSSNNTLEANIKVTATTMGHPTYPLTTAAPVYTSAYRPVGTPTTKTEGYLMSKFEVANDVRVTAVRIFVAEFGTAPNSTNNIGQTVFASVRNSAGVEVARSADRVIAAGDVNKFLTFTLPSQPRFTNEAFFVGLGVPANTSASPFFPVAIQGKTSGAEVTGVNYTSSLTGALTDLEAPVNLLIETDVEIVTGIKADVNNNAIAVYPNPSNGNFRIEFTNDLNGASAKAVEIRNVKGQLVYSANAAASSTELNVSLKDLAAGVYTLQVKSDTQLAVKRLVIE